MSAATGARIFLRRCASTAIVVACFAGCSSTKIERVEGLQELPAQVGDTRVALSAPVQIASSKKDPSVVTASLPFQLVAVPNPARLDMLVSGISSACPLATQPQGKTELFVNGKSVSSFTLGPSGVGYRHRVSADLDPALLRAGDNTLTLMGVPCTLGNFEVVKINDIVVRPAR